MRVVGIISESEEDSEEIQRQKLSSRRDLLLRRNSDCGNKRSKDSKMKQATYNIRNSEAKHGSKPNSYNKKNRSKGHNHHQHQSKNTYLNTDVTTLDMNALFAQKPIMKNTVTGRQHPQHIQPNSPHHFLSQQNYGISSFYPQQLYTGFESNLHELMSSDLPSLMSVSTYKNNKTDSFDMHQLTDELINAGNGYNQQRLLSADNNNMSSMTPPSFGDSQTSGQQKMMMSMNRNTRSAVSTRKNRMVEVKTIDDGTSCRTVVVVSDPLSATATNRPTVVQCAPRSIEKPRLSNEPVFSRKVFIGGLPIDVTEEEVWTTFGAYGKVLVDWPRRPEHGRGDFYEVDLQARRNCRSVSGYVFLVFQHEQSVQHLVNNCEILNQKFYLELSSPTMSDKAVQVRAWKLSDIDYFADNSSPIDHRRTVFIGGVPRPTRACDLARSLETLYGKVSYVGIDIDPELKYPKGAARVTFATAKSFVAAISGRFVQVIHSDTNKRVEIKPYVMEDQICDECEGKLCKFNYAPYFCGDPSCLQYYCEHCWDRMHYEMSPGRCEHRPMVRTGDQTRLLPRPPHHSHINSNYIRPNQNVEQQQEHQQQQQTQQQQQQVQHQSHQHHQQQHQQHQQQQTMMSRITGGNRNNSSSPSYHHHSIKPFSATPISIGF